MGIETKDVEANYLNGSSTYSSSTAQPREADQTAPSVRQPALARPSTVNAVSVNAVSKTLTINYDEWVLERARADTAHTDHTDERTKLARRPLFGPIINTGLS